MFGLLRTTLALMVMLYHLLLHELPIGTYAVFGFYVISGYLMTLVMHESYGYTKAGRAAFAFNRALRLYPQYWLCALLSALLIVLLGADAIAKVNGAMAIPRSLAKIASNVSMIFPAWFPIHYRPRLVPPTWALTVELFFYLLICLGISRTFARVKAWMAASVAYVGLTFLLGLGDESRYYPVAAASLPFSMGAATYFVSRGAVNLDRFVSPRIQARSLFAALLLNCASWAVLARADVGRLAEVGTYLNVTICALLVHRLAIGQAIVPMRSRVDKRIGDYSYSTYLLHWQSGAIASYLIFGTPLRGPSMRGAVSFLGALAVTWVLSTLLIHGIDEPIQRLRSKVKAASANARLGFADSGPSSARD